MLEDLEQTVEYVSNLLKYKVDATPVTGEMFSVPVTGEHGPELFVREMTTYTLGLMLSGALLLHREEQERLSSERR